MQRFSSFDVPITIYYVFIIHLLNQLFTHNSSAIYKQLTKYLINYCFVNRSTVWPSESVKSAQLLLSFMIDQLDNSWPVSILSVFNDKILVSSIFNFSHLFIYSREGLHLSTITTYDDILWDAVWVPCGNIVYTTFNSKKVVVMSEFGKIITTHTQIKYPRCLSVSNDDTMYLSGWKTGIYESTNYGISWNLIIHANDAWHCQQIIKVITDHSHDFWVLEWNDDYNWHLRVLSVDSRRSDGSVAWRDINVTTTDGKHIDLMTCSLSYDGNMNIFLSDYDNKAVHVLSVSGQNYRQLLLPNHIENVPCMLAVDKRRQLLYVGQEKGVVEVFKLSYGNGYD